MPSSPMPRCTGCRHRTPSPPPCAGAPAGRAVRGEMGGSGNIATIIGAIYQALAEEGIPRERVRNPWYFPSIGEYASLLERAGFEVVLMQLFDRPTPLDDCPNGIADWLRMFGGDFLAAVPAERRTRVGERVNELTRPRLELEGRWVADYRRLRFMAVKPRAVSQHMLQESHADEDAVVRLPEIGGAGIGVDLGRDLVDAGQRVEQDRGRAEAPHGIAVDHVLPARGLVLLQGGEPFLLHPRLIDDVDVRQHGVEIRFVAVRDGGAVELGTDVVPHRDSRRRDEDELGAGGEAEETGQRSRRAPVAQIADQGNSQPIDPPQLVADGVEIEQRLRRVLSGSIAGVEDRHGGDGGRAVGRPLLIVANDDGVGVAADDAHGVFDRLALDCRRELARILGRDDVAAELVHRRLEDRRVRVDGS